MELILGEGRGGEGGGGGGGLSSFATFFLSWACSQLPLTVLCVDAED